MMQLPQHAQAGAILPQILPAQPSMAQFPQAGQAAAAHAPAAAEAAPPSAPLDETREQAARLAAALRMSGNPSQSPQLLSFMDSVASGAVSLPHLAQAAVTGGGAAAASESPAEAALRAADAELTATWTQALQSDDPSAVEGLMEGVLGKARGLQAAQVAVAAERAQQGGGQGAEGGVSVGLEGSDDFANLTEEARQRLMEVWAGAVDSEAALDGDSMGLDMDVAVGGEGGGSAAAAAARSLDDIVPLEATQYKFTYGPGAGQAHSAFAALGEEEALAAGREALAGGRPHDAVAAFESALARESGNADAWRELGEAHAELENDPAAIVCFKRAVAEDPFNTAALLALGVSLLNERQRQDALVVLQAWLEHNEQFAGHDLPALAEAEEVPAAAAAAANAAQGLAVDQPVDAAQQTRIMKVCFWLQQLCLRLPALVAHSFRFADAACCTARGARRRRHPNSHGRYAQHWQRLCCGRKVLPDCGSGPPQQPCGVVAVGGLSRKCRAARAGGGQVPPRSAVEAAFCTVHVQLGGKLLQAATLQGVGAAASSRVADQPRRGSCVVRVSAKPARSFLFTCIVSCRAHVRVSLVCMQRFDLVAATHAQDLAALCEAMEVPR